MPDVWIVRTVSGFSNEHSLYAVFVGESNCGNSTVELKDKLSLIHSEIQAFRKESQSRMENGQKVWQLVIGGLAALVVLKSDLAW